MLVHLVSCPTCSLSKATNITLIFPVVWSIITFVTVPIAPFVNPSATSIFVVIITLALIFIVSTVHRFPVSCGLVGIVTFASSVQSSFLLSIAILVYSFPGSNLSLFLFHTSQCTFCAYTCIASCG